MDNPAATIPSTFPHPTVEPEASTPSESPNRRWLLRLLGGLVVLIIGIAIGVFSAKFLGQSQGQPLISSYADCLAAKGSILQESYPATCVTVSGSRFTQPVSAPTPLPSKASASEVDPTADWKTYTNTVYHFSVKYPSKLLESCDPSPTVDGIRFWKMPWDCPEAHDVPYTVAIIGYDKNIYRKFIRNITKTPVSSKTITVAGINSTQNFYKYTNEDGPLANFQESTEIIIPVGINVIVIQQLGSSPEDKSLFTQILSTFKFTD